ncbi:unnamed protein product, partial [marine sediment metagenome]
MAVHLWDPRVADILKTSAVDGDKNIIEFMNAHLCYCGSYQTKENLILHDILISSFPNYSGDIIGRNFSYEGDIILLETLPHTFRKEVPQSYCQIRWQPVIGKPQTCAIAGCWELLEYSENNEQVLGSNPLGRLII